MGDFVLDNERLSMGWRQKKSFCHLKQIKGLLNIDLNYASKQPAELRINIKIDKTKSFGSSQGYG